MFQVLEWNQIVDTRSDQISIIVMGTYVVVTTCHDKYQVPFVITNIKSFCYYKHLVPFDMTSIKSPLI